MPSAARAQPLLLNNKYRGGQDPTGKIEVTDGGAVNQNQKHIGDAKQPMTLIRANIVSQRGQSDNAANQLEGAHQQPDG